MATKRLRLDELLVHLGYFADEHAALGAVMAGDVVVAGKRETKAGAMVRADAEISVRGLDLKYASRGGYKLERALEAFDIDVDGLTVLDAGASTGGFTDCLLAHGAARVYAVDVGYGQMRGKLAANERVVSLERTNISDLESRHRIDDHIDLCTMDLSYLSIAKALPILHRAVGATRFVCLVKPLYEGLAESDKANIEAIVAVAARLLPTLASAGFHTRDIAISPVFGGRGAVEFLVDVATGGPGRDVAELVARLRQDWAERPPHPG